MKATAGSGKPLPSVYRLLADATISFRHGQVSLIAGPPNAGKSLFALNYAMQVGVPTLYLSADTDEFTMMMRAAAAGLTEDVHDLEAGLWSKDKSLAASTEKRVHDALAPLGHLRFGFDSNPTRDDVADEIAAFTEVWGCPPSLIVMDNLMSVEAEHESEWGGMRALMKDFHYMSRQTKAHIMVLHHTAESEKDPYSKPPSRKEIQGKVNQLPELQLTIVMDPNTGDMKIAPVKNRNGKHDASGAWYVTLHAIPSMMVVTDDRIRALSLRSRAA